MKMTEVTWKDVWDSKIEDLTLVPMCASCGDPLMIWEDDDGEI